MFLVPRAKVKNIGKMSKKTQNFIRCQKSLLYLHSDIRLYTHGIRHKELKNINFYDEDLCFYC